jgi:DNA-binding LacI/PurR family transcriptional regulator
MPEDVTIYQVAAEAGVSISTVSLTLNRPERVRASTRQQVLEVIDRLGFTPKAEAVSHARKSIPRLGVMAPFTAYDSYRRRLAGILTESASRTEDIVVFDQVSAAVAAAPMLDSLPVTRRLDGLLIMGLPLEDHLAKRLLQRRLPTVLVDSRRPEFSSVTIDDERGGWLVARHLLERGRDSFAVMSEPQRSGAYVSQGELRRAGFRKAVAEAGLDADAVSFVATKSDLEGGRAAIRHLHAEGRLPSAIFAHEDVLAAGILRECRALGIRVPDDLAVVGFDDGPLAEALDVTTVRQPLETSGRIGVRLLHQALADPEGPVQHITLELELVVRGSTSSADGG